MSKLGAMLACNRLLRDIIDVASKARWHHQCERGIQDNWAVYLVQTAKFLLNVTKNSTEVVHGFLNPLWGCVYRRAFQITSK